MNVARALTIAGSDSGGGAGIQADLKTFTSLKVYGLSVITSLTAQNTREVISIHELPVRFIGEQFDASVGDIGCDAVKIGMLSNGEIIRCVADKIREYELENVVLDPVMISKGGSRLLRKDAVEVLINELLPLSLVVTPNIAEAEVLSGISIRSLSDMKEAARKISLLGCRNVIIKGGHITWGTEALDILFDGKEFKQLSNVRINTQNTHGTGCTFSSAICAGLAKGYGLYESTAQAKDYTTNAIKNALPLGRGYGPLMHYWNIT